MDALFYCHIIFFLIFRIFIYTYYLYYNRYGDKHEYCNHVLTDRCLTETRVVKDCCKTCKGLAPTDICVNLGNICSELLYCYTRGYYGKFR